MTSDQARGPHPVDLSAPLIVGYGVVGRAVARALDQRGHEAIVIEDRPNDDSRAIAAEAGIDLVEAPDLDLLRGLVTRASVLLPSPGVPDHHPCFALAIEQGLGVCSEFDLARLWDDRPVAAITGTNGKTTVTTLVTDALNRSGRRAAAVGNTDIPLVAALDDPETEIFVVEASSFRLAHSQWFEPLVATWLNFAPDHLDAHASLGAYERAKASIWDHLPVDGLAVANGDDPVVLAHLPAARRVEQFSTLGTATAWHVADGHLVGPDGPFLSVTDLVRSQPHDLANALATAATARAAGAGPAAIAEALVQFTGLAHRMELVGCWNDVRWFNDSKATVPQATVAAVNGLASVVLIAGGRNKGLALDDLRATAPPVHHVVAIGDSAGEVGEVFAGVVPVSVASDMAEAVTLAERVARPGDAVLLSPGCASFDWYRNYGERGHDYMRLVRLHMEAR